MADDQNPQADEKDKQNGQPEKSGDENLSPEQMKAQLEKDLKDGDIEILG
ncbi:MAG TPA: hypothetical protein VHF05_00935 [Candidatus Paceibacterota bacterium]|jgi:hypothetical protein|nr:hypothetical protein [Candidatus Paceibacterota bacterium]